MHRKAKIPDMRYENGLLMGNGVLHNVKACKCTVVPPYVWDSANVNAWMAKGIAQWTN